MTQTSVRFLVIAASLTVMLAQAHAQTADPHHPAGQAASQAGQGQTTAPSAPGAQPGAMGAGMGSMMDKMRPMMGAGGMGLPFEHIEGRIASLKAELAITDAQSAPWGAFADAMRADAATMRTMHEEMTKRGMMKGATPLALPERLAAQRKMMSERAAMLDRLEAGTKPLYAVLSAEQRKVMDQAVPGPMGMM